MTGNATTLTRQTATAPAKKTGNTYGDCSKSGTLSSPRRSNRLTQAPARLRNGLHVSRRTDSDDDNGRTGRTARAGGGHTRPFQDAITAADTLTPARPDQQQDMSGGCLRRPLLAPWLAWSPAPR